MLELLIAIRTWRNVRKIVTFRAVAVDEIARQAAAYGWEVGTGQPLLSVLEAQPDNPFLNPAWREGVINNG